MTKDEALKLALWHEAMAREPNRNQAKREKHEATAKFIKESLAQSEQYPQIAINPEIVGYVAPQLKIEGSRHVICQCDKCKAQPEQEPVAWRVKVETKLRNGLVDVGYQVRSEKLSKHDEPLYTTPPQRTFVGLTDVEIEQAIELISMLHGDYATEVAYAIEAKLKERNT